MWTYHPVLSVCKLSQDVAELHVVVVVEVGDLSSRQTRKPINTDQLGVVRELESSQAPQALEPRDCLQKLKEKKIPSNIAVQALLLVTTQAKMPTHQVPGDDENGDFEEGVEAIKVPQHVAHVGNDQCPHSLYAPEP